MSQENAATARRWFEEVWNQRRAEAIYEMTLPTTVGRTGFGDMVGPEVFHRQIHEQFLAGFPDLHLHVEDVIAERDMVAVRWSATGTHTGPCLECDPSGQKITFGGITWMRIQNGKLVEAWDHWDAHGLIQELAQRSSEQKRQGVAAS